MEIKRDFYLQKLIDRENNGLIKIVRGIRRCGKSYLLNNLFCNYLNKKGVDNDHIIKVALNSEEKFFWLLTRIIALAFLFSHLVFLVEIFQNI